MGLYKHNRQEITSIFTNSIILLVISIISGVSSFFLFNSEEHDSEEYLVFSIIVFLAGIFLCLLYKQLITLGWMNFQIEKELKFQKFGNEHGYFIEEEEFVVLEKWFYSLICSSYFQSDNKVYYHINLKFIILIIFLSSIASSVMFYKYLASTLPCFLYKELVTFLILPIMCLVLITISFLFFRNEFKVNQGNEN